MTGRQATVAKSRNKSLLMYKYALNTRSYHEIGVKKLYALWCGPGKFFVAAGVQDRVIQQWLLWI